MDCQPAARDSLRAVARACDDIPSVLDATASTRRATGHR
jgi:hypothetical protein